ncbi:MAG: serine dehydratase subunit alpha family protein [Burkholderiales bacterium]|uniref:L-cysteine desulfidase family protein n=1 Tax=uncultured Turicimonas sp. TaxID=1918607 RepID=UPI001ED31671|nr:L-serine ammonia-lyase, iron-sulfur-dependent, subunit alpha [uncultured Turicimonas sp.]MBS4845703.1 serine dehydratase subunit alpha family protein [Burkholderiales bacterium]
MLNKTKRDQIISLINREVVPALGCTEPIAVALCVAKARELLGEMPEKIRLSLSGNIIKNAMGVGIPGTGMIGLPIAVALGALIGKSELGLEVLQEVNEEAVEKAKVFLDKDCIEIIHDEEAPSNLFIDTVVSHGTQTARAVISRNHTHFVFLEKNGERVYEEEGWNNAGAEEDEAEEVQLDMKTVYEFATESPIEEISFILRARDMNKKAAELALAHDYGHSLGAMIKNRGARYFGDTTVAHMISYTSAACDARMGGAAIAVMSNSGSGNQGITATMPVVAYAEDCDASDEQLIRALTLSHLTSIYIKQNLGRLSALCGCVVASTGASSGITWLMGGKYEEVCAAIKNMIANLAGMLCDGAKPACSLKISSGVSTAMMSALLAMNEHCVTKLEGIVSDDIDETIRNLTAIGKESMMETDKQVLQIMICK